MPHSPTFRARESPSGATRGSRTRFASLARTHVTANTCDASCQACRTKAYTSPSQPEPTAGIEPALPPYQGGVLPLNQRGKSTLCRRGTRACRGGTPGGHPGTEPMRGVEPPGTPYDGVPAPCNTGGCRGFNVLRPARTLALVSAPVVVPAPAQEEDHDDHDEKNEPQVQVHHLLSLVLPGGLEPPLPDSESGVLPTKRQENRFGHGTRTRSCPLREGRAEPAHSHRTGTPRRTRTSTCTA